MVGWYSTEPEGRQTLEPWGRQYLGCVGEMLGGRAGNGCPLPLGSPKTPKPPPTGLQNWGPSPVPPCPFPGSPAACQDRVCCPRVKKTLVVNREAKQLNRDVSQSLGFAPFSPRSHFLLLKKGNAGTPSAVGQPGGCCLQPGLCGSLCPLTECNSGKGIYFFRLRPSLPSALRTEMGFPEPAAPCQGRGLAALPVLGLCPSTPLPAPLWGFTPPSPSYRVVFFSRVFYYYDKI